MSWKRAMGSCFAVLFAMVVGCDAGRSQVVVGGVDGGGTSSSPTEPNTGDDGDDDDGGAGKPRTEDGGATEPTDCTECPKGCFDLETDVSNCGSCGLKCPTPDTPGVLATCTKGECGEGCSSGTTYCQGTCADTQTDRQNCGGCGKSCPAPTGGTSACVAGSCKPTCSPSATLCGSACVNTTTDVKNCGACGHVCPAAPGETATCTAGVCGTTCSTGYTICNGECVNLQADRDNCGACGTKCAADSTTTQRYCSTGKCYDLCIGGTTRCSPPALNGSDSVCCQATSRCCYAPPRGVISGYPYCGSATSC